VIAAVDARRIAAQSMFVFATLTQKKRARWIEGPRAAVSRISETWSSLTNTRRAIGRWFHAIFRGGLRSTETTFAKKGDKHFRGGGRVKVSGYHAHLHVLLEVREGIDLGEAIAWLRAAWLMLSPESEAVSQVIRKMCPDDAQQLCKYVTKPLEDNASRPAVLRELFAGLHGLRLLQAFGEWQAKAGVREGWRASVDEENPDAGQPRYEGPEIGDLMRVATRRIEGTTGRVLFVGVHLGDERRISAELAWAMIGRAVADRARVVQEKLQESASQAGFASGAPPPTVTC
jgi:hypothetical protein